MSKRQALLRAYGRKPGNEPTNEEIDRDFTRTINQAVNALDDLVGYLETLQEDGLWRQAPNTPTLGELQQISDYLSEMRDTGLELSELPKVLTDLLHAAE